MVRNALLRTAIATLLVASATQAQTLDQTLSGCTGAAPLIYYSRESSRGAQIF
jgi:hypothetical protein